MRIHGSQLEAYRFRRICNKQIRKIAFNLAGYSYPKATTWQPLVGFTDVVVSRHAVAGNTEQHQRTLQMYCHLLHILRVHKYVVRRASVSTQLCRNLQMFSQIYTEQKGQVRHKSNIEASLRRHCWCGKAISDTYSECVFVALVIQHAMRMRHIVICGLPSCAVFLHIIT